MNQNNRLHHVWLTDFCQSMHIFTAIVVIQIVVVIYALSFLSFDVEFLRKLSILTLLSQLTGLTIVILLCKLRPMMNRMAVLYGVLLVVLLVVLITTAVAQAIGYLDMQLTFDLLKSQQQVNHLNVKLTVASVLICLALIRYFYVQDQWHQQVTKLSDAQLRALQARIKPHFFFNTLNSIASLISFDAQRAEQAVTDFASLMRRAFIHQEAMITVEQELKWVRQYLAIEQLRLGDRLSFQIHGDEALQSLKIPVLCLQPLVENAILHGIQPLESGGEIYIGLSADEACLHIDISNPCDPQAQGPSNGVALNNIRERLQLHYGAKASMQLHNHDGVFRIQLTVPK